MENQRFVARLAESEPELANYLTREFDEAKWSQYWNATWAEMHAWLWAQVVDHTKRSWAEFVELRASERRYSS
jgi:hypothetical protein